MNRALVIVSRITFVFFFLTIFFVSDLKVFGGSTTVIAWGDNTYKQINLPPNLTNAVAIAQGGLNGLALNYDGTLTAWGNHSVGATNVPSGLSNAVAIAVGYGVSLALTSDGTVLQWGAGSQPPAGLSNVVAIAASIFHCLALRNDGSVVAWGDFNTYGEDNVPPNLANAIAVAAGEENSVALLNDGHVVVWGNNTYGQTNVPANATNVVAIAAGSDFIMALRWDGRVVAWGGGTSVPNGLSNVVAIAGGVNQGLALKSDGKLVVWGSGAQPPAGLSNVVAISAGSADNAALINDGSPWIERQPLSQTTFSGMDYTFKVLATGKTNLYYQWQFNGTNLVAATNTSLSLTNLHVTDSGNYSVAISNSIGSTVSSTGVLSVVTSAPIIITQPANQVAALRSNVLVTVSATGSLPLSYQWQFNGTNLLRATNTFLSVTNVQWTNEGNYNVVITNAYGSTTSSNSFLNVVDLAEAVNATNLTWSSSASTGWFPEGSTTHDGVAAAQSGSLSWPQYSTLQTTVSGPGTLVFWWKVYQFGDFLVFSASGTSPQSVGTMTTSWQIQTVYLGTGNQTLQWAFQRSPFSGTAQDAGWLDQVSFVAGGTPPIVNSISSDQTIPAGTNVTFRFSAVGTPPLNAQWQFSGTNIASATNSTYALTNVQAVDSGVYSIVVSNAYGLGSSNISLTVAPALPTIIVQPTNQAIWIRSNVTFQVAALGSIPFSYQWQFNGTNIVGETNSTLYLTNLQKTNAGSYQAVVSNAYGSATSSNALLSVVTSAVVVWGGDSSGQTTIPVTCINPSMVSSAADASFALSVNGDNTVSTWGDGPPTLPVGLTNVVAVAAEAYDGVALKNDGTVVIWGSDFYGQADLPPRLGNVIKIAAGDIHMLALRKDGTVFSWGPNNNGQINSQVNVPAGLNNVVAIAAGSLHSVALTGDSTLVAWGDNSQGQTNVPPGLSNVVDVAASSTHNLALKNDSTVVAWGGEATNVPAGLSNVVAIACAAGQSMVLKNDGTVLVWGDNTYGQTNVPPGLTNVVALGGGANFSLAIVNDGSPWIVRQPASQVAYDGTGALLSVIAMGVPPLNYQWQLNGTNIDGATNAILGLTNLQTNNMGNYGVVVSNVLGTTLSSNATVSVFPPASGIISQPASESVLPGASATFNVTARGVLPLNYQWQFNGTNIDGATNVTFILNSVQTSDFGNYDIVVSNAYGSAYSSNTTLTPAQILAWGDNTYSQTNVPPGLSNIVAISAGYYHALALKNDGTVSTWGASTNNVFSIVDYGQTIVPAGLSNVVAVAAGMVHNLALKSDGSLVVWGSNNEGETNIPPSATNVIAIAAGWNHCLALKNDSTVVAWGRNADGETNVPSGLSNVVGIAAGGYHSLALKKDGTVVAWGNYHAGQNSVPVGLTNVIAMAEGSYHSMALKRDGTVVCWGRNAEGESTPPIGLSNVVAISGGKFHSLALKADGTLVGWGYDKSGQIDIPSSATNVVAIGAGGFYSAALLKSGYPFVVSPLKDQVVYSGQTATFNTSAWGTAPLNYQWQFNEANIGGATNTTLVLTNVPLVSAGNYQLTVSNIFGAVASTSAKLTVLRSTPQFISSYDNSGGFGQGFKMQLNGLSGHGPVILYSSTDLVNWLPIFTNPPVMGYLQLSVSNAVNVPFQFYRVGEQ